MPRYSIEVAGAAAANNAATAQFWAPTRRATVREIAVFNTSGVNALPALKLARSSARGTPSTTVTPTAASNGYDTNDVGPTLLVDTAFTVQPTFLALNMRGVEIPAVIENGIIWSWVDEIDGAPKVNVNSGLVLFNQSGGAWGSGPRIYIDWQE